MGKEIKKIKKKVEKSKQPTLKSLVKDEVEAYNTYFDIPFIPFGQTDPVQIRIYPLFSPQKVAITVNEYIGFINKAVQEKINITPEEEGDLLGYFVIKNFTNVKTTTSKKAKTVYDEFKMLVNSRFYTEIISFFPEESMRAVHERLFEIIEASDQLNTQFKQIQKEAEKVINENKETFDVLAEALKNKENDKNEK